jgi:hypothetical protein
VQALYKYVVPKPKAECSKNEQLLVSFAAGYIAGVFCAVVSHPADNLVSKLNANKGATIGGIVNEMGWCAGPSPAAPQLGLMLLWILLFSGILAWCMRVVEVPAFGQHTACASLAQRSCAAGSLQHGRCMGKRCRGT